MSLVLFFIIDKYEDFLVKIYEMMENKNVFNIISDSREANYQTQREPSVISDFKLDIIDEFDDLGNSTKFSQCSIELFQDLGK